MEAFLFKGHVGHNQVMYCRSEELTVARGLFAIVIELLEDKLTPPLFLAIMKPQTMGK
jgi:hypothetical protein